MNRQISKKSEYGNWSLTREIRISLTITLLFFASLLSAPVSVADNLPGTQTKFSNPQAVEIEGLPDGADGTPISTEEPFLSRDNRFLFFNTGKDENNKDLQYAESINHKWIYKGQLGPDINTAKEVEGNPTMDDTYNFFYIESGVKSMVCTARFSPEDGTLRMKRELEGIPPRKVAFFRQRLYGNMGVEVSADSSYLFLSRATWKLRGFAIGALTESNILYMKKQNGRYVYNEKETEKIMRNVNTSDLEYAASISSDGLELFFTRLKIEDVAKGKIRSTIMHATRTSLAEAFGKPTMVEAIGSSDFVEGPAISGDGKELYYHKYDGKKFRLYKVTR